MYLWAMGMMEQVIGSKISTRIWAAIESYPKMPKVELEIILFSLILDRDGPSTNQRKYNLAEIWPGAANRLSRRLSRRSLSAHQCALHLDEPLVVLRDHNSSVGLSGSGTQRIQRCQRLHKMCNRKPPTSQRFSLLIPQVPPSIRLCCTHSNPISRASHPHHGPPLLTTPHLAGSPFNIANSPAAPGATLGTG